MGTMDVTVSTTDSLGSVDPDGAPGAESPWWSRAPVPLMLVVVVVVVVWRFCRLPIEKEHCSHDYLRRYRDTL